MKATLALTAIVRLHLFYKPSISKTSLPTNHFSITNISWQTRVHFSSGCPIPPSLQVRHLQLLFFRLQIYYYLTDLQRSENKLNSNLHRTSSYIIQFIWRLHAVEKVSLGKKNEKLGLNLLLNSCYYDCIQSLIQHFVKELEPLNYIPRQVSAITA